MNYSDSMFYVVNEDINVRGNIGVKKRFLHSCAYLESISPDA